MDRARPKSSKGRTRPVISADRTGDSAGAQRGHMTARPEETLRSRSQPSMWPDSRVEVLPGPGAPLPPPPSLNKYRVLPSIGRRRGDARDLRGQTSDSDATPDLSGEVPEPGPEPSEFPGCAPSCPPGSLLLAVRAPCGRRFEQRFQPTDALRTVRSSAEARYGAWYGEVCIEAVEVPRRIFTDLDLTLAQCGIRNRSVLCICQNTTE